MTLGSIIPTDITWEDSLQYRIDRVTKVRCAASMRAGGKGERYTVMIRGRQSYLYFERSNSLTEPNHGQKLVGKN